jgi:hypothetical protein
VIGVTGDAVHFFFRADALNLKVIISLALLASSWLQTNPIMQILPLGHSFQQY